MSEDRLIRFVVPDLRAQHDVIGELVSRCECHLRELGAGVGSQSRAAIVVKRLAAQSDRELVRDGERCIAGDALPDGVRAGIDSTRALLHPVIDVDAEGESAGWF